MIKTVIFDLGRVLIPFDFARGYQAMEGLCPHDAAEIRRRLGATDLVERFETGLVEPADFVTELSTLIDLDVDYPRFCQIWSSIFLPDPLIPDAMLAALHRRYRLVLLSNTNAIHFEMVRETYPLIRHFDGLVLSHEVKAMKPDPRIYRAAIAAAQCEPGECFYTDDIAAYVQGAKEMGIDAVQFESCAQISAALRARGVEW
jgi:putative hydrolase of the HAD superfamily